ncbi:MAG: sporulation protein YqfD [Firmicutes bacterium]|nr:sporulation protein YqfD [Bacillota bacterium]
MKRLASYWTGYLVVTIEGEQKERLLNLALSKGISFWDLGFEQGQAVFKMKVRDYMKLRPLARRTNCRLKIKDKAGRPFLVNRGKKRKGFLLGALFFFFILYLSTSFVWFIRITGNEEVPQEKVMSLLRELEIRPGTWKKKIDLDYLSDRLVLEFEEITWASASLQGTLLEVNVVEKIKIPEASNAPADLVAKKDGVVTNVLVLAGEARVEEGDTVRRGDLLIEGVNYTLPEGKGLIEDEADDLQLVPIRARGVVEARVWYEGLGEVNLWEIFTVPTGQVASSYLLKYNEDVVGSWGVRQPPYRNYQLKKINHHWVWRNIRLPVELITLKYYELGVKKKKLSPEEALQKAGEEAWEMINKQLAPGLPVLRKHQEDRIFSEKVSRKILLETKENIAVLKPKEMLTDAETGGF